MSTRVPPARLPALIVAALSIGAVFMVTGVSRAGPASSMTASTSETSASPTPSDVLPSPASPQATIYPPEEYEEASVPDEFTGVGPFTAEFPCAGLSVKDAAEIVPSVDGASIDGECYYGHLEAVGEDVLFDDAFSVDVHDLASPDQAADWLSDAEQRFYNGVYSDGSPPEGEGCEAVEDLGVETRWCWAPMEYPALLFRTDDLGVELEWFGVPDQQAGRDEAADRAVLTSVAARILETIGVPASGGSATTAGSIASVDDGGCPSEGDMIPQSSPPTLRSGSTGLALELAYSVMCGFVIDGPASLGQAPRAQAVVGAPIEVLVAPSLLDSASISVIEYRATGAAVVATVRTDGGFTFELPDGRCYAVTIGTQTAHDSTTWIALISTDPQGCAEFAN